MNFQKVLLKWGLLISLIHGQMGFAEMHPDPFAFSYPYELDIRCEKRLSIYGSFLAMQAKQDGMEFAIEDLSGNGQIPISPITYGKVFGFTSNRSDWDFQPGFRLGATYLSHFDFWKFGLEWTRLNISAYKHANVSNERGVLIPLWILGSNTPSGAMLYNQDAVCDLYVTPNAFGPRASAVWKAKYDMVDLSMRKEFYISRNLVAKPFFGIRGGSIQQHFSVDYGGGYREADVTPCALCETLLCPEMGASRIVHHGDNNFYGVGLRIGVDSSWFLGQNWAFQGAISSSFLAGKMKVSQNMTLPNQIQCPDLVNCINGSGPCTNVTSLQTLVDGFDITQTSMMNLPNLEMSVGIEWARRFNKDKYQFRFQGAYEFIHWWNMLNMRKFFSSSAKSQLLPEGGCGLDTVSAGAANDVVSDGNFSLNGFSVRFSLDL